MTSSSSTSASKSAALVDFRRHETLNRIVTFINEHADQRLVIAIDGRTGAGKTTLANDVASRLVESVCTLEVELFIEGWDGLIEGVQRIADTIVVPFKDQGWARARAWDWHREQWAGWQRIPETGQARVLLLTGCGSSSGPLAAHLDASVWIDRPANVRRKRVVERDGDPSQWWKLWTIQEDTLLARHDSPAHATWNL